MRIQGGRQGWWCKGGRGRCVGGCPVGLVRKVFMKKKMKKRGFSCMYMFADDANTGNRRCYCHFLYWKNSVPLIEFIDCDSGVGKASFNYGYMEGASFVMAQDPPRFTGRPTPFSGFESVASQIPLQSGKTFTHPYIKICTFTS